MYPFKQFVTSDKRWVQAEHLALAEAPAKMQGFCLTTCIAWLIKCNEVGADQALAALGKGESKQSYAMARQLMWNEYQHGWLFDRLDLKKGQGRQFLDTALPELSAGRLARLPYFREFSDLPSFWNAIRECVAFGARELLICLDTEQHAVAIWMTESDLYALDVNWGMAGSSRTEPKVYDIVTGLLASYLLLYRRFWSTGAVFPVISTVLPPRSVTHAGRPRRSSISSASPTEHMPSLQRKKTL